VRASSGSLPGDQLYTVKRTWEDVRLFFAFDEPIRQKLEHEFEQERVQEIGILLDEGRVEKVNFQGAVESQDGEIWVVGGIKIKISDDVVISPGVILGTIVQVIGETDDGIINAEQVILLQTPAIKPPIIQTTTAKPTMTFGPVHKEEKSGTIEPVESTEPAQTEEDAGGEDKSKTPEPSNTQESQFEPTQTPKPSKSGSGESGGGGNDNSGGGDDGDHGGSGGGGSGDDNNNGG
jgi:uncharacterized membrane protein YgcG